MQSHFYFKDNISCGLGRVVLSLSSGFDNEVEVI